jgi:di/tricarboxylate transporter
MESATSRARGTESANDRPASRNTVRRLTTETKQAFKTTEFWAMVGVIVAILVAASLIKGGDTAPGTDEFVAKQAWLYVSIVAVGYMISRGLAKSGSRDPYTDDSDDHGRQH